MESNYDNKLQTFPFLIDVPRSCDFFDLFSADRGVLEVDIKGRESFRPLISSSFGETINEPGLSKMP